MANLFPIQSSFNGGEVAPRLAGRFDLEMYRNSCRTVENFILHPHGSASRRPGTRYVASTKTDGKRARLVLFEYGVADSYVLEFGDLYVRIYYGGARIEAGGVPLEYVTPYTEAQLRSLRFCQSADVLYIWHKDHAPRKFRRLLADGSSWQLDAITFLPMPTYEADTPYFATMNTMGLGAVSGEGVHVYIGGGVGTPFYEGDVGRGIRSGAGLGSIVSYVGAQEVTMDVLDAFPSSLVAAQTPTVESDAGGTVFTLTGGTHDLEVGDYAVITSGTYAGIVRYVSVVPDDTHFTVDASYGGVVAAGTTWSKSTAIAAGSYSLTASPVGDCLPSAVGPVNAIINLTLRDPGTTTARDGWRTTDIGKYACLLSGIAKITSRTSASVVKARVLVPLVVSPIVAAAPGAWTVESEAWSAANGYPRAGSFYEERLMAAGSTAFPTTVWGSASGDYENFGVGPFSDDALEYVVAANTVNEIRWMEAMKALLLGTAGTEYRISGGGDSAMTPANVQVRPDDSNGSADVSPVRIHNAVVCVQRAGRKPLLIQYDYAPDAFTAADLSALADHLTVGGIVEIAYQREPLPVLWCVRADGVLLGCTYDPAQKVVAWHRHVTDGLVESVCVCPTATTEEVWIVVARTVGGATVRYVERIVDGSHVGDACTVYSGAATATITGLSHLNGEAVAVVADGFEIPGLTVAGGQVVLPAAATAVTVGLPFTSTLTPNRPDFQGDRLSTMGKKKRWVDAWVRVLETIGITINGDTPAFRDGADALGTAPAAYTGDIRLENLGTEGEPDIVVTQTKPFPATILCIGGTLEVGG